MQIGVAAYLRNISVRCTRLARSSADVKLCNALGELSTELTDKAEGLEKLFAVPAQKK